MNHIVIQPHTDDAYLSLHSHMVRWLKAGDEVIIVTCWAGKRAFEATGYAKALGAEHSFLWKDQEHHPDYVEAPAGEGPALPMLLPIDSSISQEVQIYLPLGIQHQEHRSVANAENYGWSPRYYLDTPYYAKTTRHQEVNDLMKGKIIESFEAPSGRKYQDKWWKIFKTQSMFFHYNLGKLKGLPEIIVRQYQ